MQNNKDSILITIILYTHMYVYIVYYYVKIHICPNMIKIVYIYIVLYQHSPTLNEK